MSQRTNQEPTRPLPMNYVIGGVIDSLQEAEQAVQTLQGAGYSDQDILLIPSQDFIEAIQQRRQQTSAFNRAMHAFSVSSDEGFPADLYLRQARKGSHMLAVYASTREQAQKIAQLLSTYDVHLLKYFSRWAVTDFPS